MNNKIISNLIGYYGQTINMETVHNYFDKIKPIKNPIFSNKIPLFLNETDLCLSYYDGKNIKIYPIKILNKRRIVYDKLYDNNNIINVSITYSPLTGSPIVYEGLWGFSGMIYNNNDILYNKNNNKDLMTQILGVIIYGDKVGSKPKKWPLIIAPLNKLYNKSSMILQGELNDNIDYNDNIFEKYSKENYIDYPINDYSNKYHSKKLVYVIDKYILIPNNKNKKTLIENDKIYYDNNITSYIFQNNNKFIIPMYWFASYVLFNKSTVINI